MGPLNDAMKKDALEQQGDIKYDIEWTTLGEYLDYLERARRLPQRRLASSAPRRCASTSSATRTARRRRGARAHAGARARRRWRRARSASAPRSSTRRRFYAKTDELIALCKAAAEYGGMYISHMRSEGNRLLEAVDELIRIAREAGVRAEIYHLKAAGEPNWPKLDAGRSRGSRPRARAGLAHHRRHVHRTPPAPPGSTRRCRRGCRRAGSTPGSSACKDPAIRARVRARDAHARPTTGRTCTARGGLADERAPGRLQERRAQAAHRQDAGRGGAAARQVARGDGDGPGDRGRQPRRHRLLPDVRGQRRARRSRCPG